jgi:Phospholipase_D-nuclease N-terminal
MATSTRGQQYCHDPVGCGHCNVRDVEGLTASVVLIAILLGVLLAVVFDIFCLLRLVTADAGHFLPKFAWAVLIVCVSPIGGLVYLLAQAPVEAIAGAGNHAAKALTGTRSQTRRGQRPGPPGH